MHPLPIIAALALAGTIAPAQTAPAQTFALPHAFDGYSQPEITQCSSLKPTQTECSVPAMTAGSYVLVASGAATSTGADATQSLAIVVGGQPCAVTNPAAFTDKKVSVVACEVTILTDQPLKVTAFYVVKNGTPDAAGPKLAFRRAAWTGVLNAHPVPIRASKEAPSKDAATKR